ncbi:MAG TPA: YIP1 family protein [Myxococcales bacterium]|nr:YIP1 family protein [Myxococcales bacterium]
MSEAQAVEVYGRMFRPPAAAVALVAPEAGMERVARTGRVRGPLLIALACALLSASAGILRVDAKDATLRAMDKAGELQTSSDRQVEDATKSAERIYYVKRVAGALVEPPLQLGLLCVAIFGLGWFFRGRTEGRAVPPVAAAALLPLALANLLEAFATYQHAAIAPDGPPSLPRTLADFWTSIAAHPAPAPLLKLLGAFDVFSFWSALLVAFGLAAAAQLPRRRALTGTLAAWLCMRLLTQVAMGGH